MAEGAHSHCPDGCEHPQPQRVHVTRAAAELFYLDPSLSHEVCGRCLLRFGELVVMVPCTPATCVEARG